MGVISLSETEVARRSRWQRKRDKQHTKQYKTKQKKNQTKQTKEEKMHLVSTTDHSNPTQTYSPRSKSPVTGRSSCHCTRHAVGPLSHRVETLHTHCVTLHSPCSHILLVHARTNRRVRVCASVYNIYIWDGWR